MPKPKKTLYLEKISEISLASLCTLGLFTIGFYKEYTKSEDIKLGLEELFPLLGAGFSGAWLNLTNRRIKDVKEKRFYKGTRYDGRSYEMSLDKDEIRNKGALVGLGIGAGAYFTGRFIGNSVRTTLDYL